MPEHEDPAPALTEQDENAAGSQRKANVANTLASLCALFRKAVAAGRDKWSSRRAAQKSRGSARKLRLSLAGVGGVLTIAIGAFAVWNAWNTDVLVRKFFASSTLADAISGEYLVQAAIERLPGTLRDWDTKQKFARLAYQDTRVGSDVSTTDEGTFCRPWDSDSLWTTASGALKPENRPNIELQSRVSTDILSQAGVPLQTLVEWLSPLFGRRYTTLDFALEGDTDEFRLKTFVRVFDGRSLYSAEFISAPKHGLANAQSLLDEMILRVSYPEVSSQIRTKRGAHQLDVERFVATHLPSSRRRDFLDIAHADMLLNNPYHSDDLPRHLAATLLEDVWMSKLAERQREPSRRPFPEDPNIDLRRLAARTFLLRADLSEGLGEGSLVAREKPITQRTEAAKFRAIAYALLEEEAKLAGAQIFDDWPRRGFSAISNNWNFLHHRLLVSAARGEARLELERRRYDDLLAWARSRAQSLDANDQSMRRVLASALRNELLLHATISMQFVLDGLVGGGDEGRIRAEIAVLNRVVDDDLPWVQREFSALSATEVAFIESVGAYLELLSGDFHHGIAWFDRLKSSLDACSIMSAGTNLLELSPVIDRIRARLLMNRDVPTGRVDTHRSVRIAQLSRSLFQSAGARGISNLDLHNYIGIAATRAGDHADAMKAFEKAAQFKGERSWVYLNRGAAWLAAGKPSARSAREAERWFRKSIEEEGAQERDLLHDLDLVKPRTLIAKKQITEIREQLFDRRDPCQGVYRSRSGLLKALAFAEDPREFVRQYRLYQALFTGGCGVHVVADELFFGETLSRWHCSGSLKELPNLPAAFVKAGRFGCRAQQAGALVEHASGSAVKSVALETEGVQELQVNSRAH